MAATAVTADGPAASDTAPRVKIIFGGLLLVMLLAALDQTIVATAMPTIVGDLGGLDKLSWVTSSFLLAQTAVTPIYGKLGDLYGRKRVLQTAVVVFLIGSALCGLSGSMTQLIAFRAVQGLGAGGLIVLIQATIGDIVPPRERGRYQGLFGAVFGFASVAGPLLGGVIVENVSWRWIFYVNLPVGVVALGVLSIALPAIQGKAKPSIDYLGAGLLASGLSAIVLVTSLGGSTWDWGSGELIATAIVGVLLLVGFGFTERRADEPILPPALLKNRTFNVAGSLSAAVGFALFGTVIFLPLYFQTVAGASPTGAGLRLVPMMGGVVVVSTLSGQIISRTGRYKRFPVAGTLIMAVGLFLLSRLEVETSSAVSALYLLVLGIGLGSTMQVLVLAVQNSVDFSVLGAATSGTTMLRGIGGSIGTAVFGTIFTNGLTSNLHGALPAGASGGAERLTGDQVAKLPAPAKDIYEHAFVNAMHPVFIVAGCIAVLAFVLSLALEEKPLRAAAATNNGVDDALAVPRGPDSLAEVDRALSRCTSAEQRRKFYARIAERANVDLTPPACWALARITDYGPDLAIELAKERGVPPERIEQVITELQDHGFVQDRQLTDAGKRTAEIVIQARRDVLEEALADHPPDRDPRVEELLQRLARELAGEPPKAVPQPA